MSIHKNIEEKIREICTYYSELGEGTAGYDLSEDQFQKLFTLFEEQYQKGREDERRNAHQAMNIITNKRARSEIDDIQMLMEIEKYFLN